MSSVRKGPATGAKEAERLLLLLAEKDAFAARLEEDESRIAIAAPRNGVTLRIGIARAPVVAALIEAGLAEWLENGARPRLFLTEPGAAAARRAGAKAKGHDPFLAQHLPLTRRTEPEGGARLLIDESESPLAWLSRRRGKTGEAFLEPHEVEAGERLRREATFAQVMPGVTMNWSATAGGGFRSDRGLDPTEAMIAARQRLDRALRFVGPESSGLLLDVCVFLKKLDLVEKERGWPARSAKIVLRLALAQLARHYGLMPEARSRGGPMRSWGAPDHRPAIDGERVQA